MARHRAKGIVMTGRALRFDLDMPPSVNAAFANVAGRGRVLSASARTWKKRAAMEISLQARGIRFMGQYNLAVKLSDAGLTHDRDCDNALKLLLDAIVKSGAVIDDNHRCLRSIDLEWRPDLPPGTCRVVIAELSPLPISRRAKPARAPRRIGTAQIGPHAAPGVAEASDPGQDTGLQERPPTGQRHDSGSTSEKPQAIKRNIPASIMSALRRRGIRVSPERVAVQ